MEEVDEGPRPLLISDTKTNSLAADLRWFCHSLKNSSIEELAGFYKHQHLKKLDLEDGIYEDYLAFKKTLESINIGTIMVNSTAKICYKRYFSLKELSSLRVSSNMRYLIIAGVLNAIDKEYVPYLPHGELARYFLSEGSFSLKILKLVCILDFLFKKTLPTFSSLEIMCLGKCFKHFHRYEDTNSLVVEMLANKLWFRKTAREGWILCRHKYPKRSMAIDILNHVEPSFEAPTLPTLDSDQEDSDTAMVSDTDTSDDGDLSEDDLFFFNRESWWERLLTRPDPKLIDMFTYCSHQRTLSRILRIRLENGVLFIDKKRHVEDTELNFLYSIFLNFFNCFLVKGENQYVTKLTTLSRGGRYRFKEPEEVSFKMFISKVRGLTKLSYHPFTGLLLNFVGYLLNHLEKIERPLSFITHCD